MRRATLIVLFGGLLCGLLARPASARKQYYDEFKEKYGADKDFGQVIDEAKCFVCHVGKSKKNRNDYGMALSKAIGKNEKGKDKINEALGKIEDQKAADGKTFGELIKEGKLPGGEPQKD